MMIYFKRVPNTENESENEKSDNLYNQINKFIRFRENNPREGDKNKTAFKMDNGEVPKNRTLIIINFDKGFQVKQTMGLFKLCGPIRRVFTGTLKVDKKRVYVGLVVFSNEYDLTKCFEMDYFQQRIYKKYSPKVDKEKVEKYQQNLFNQYEVVLLFQGLFFFKKK